MRPGQSNKRGRGRGGRKGPSPLSRSYESNGPDVKIRGTAQHIADKYINLARDAQSSGDTVLSEAYFQHAEHFYRIVAAAQQQMNQQVNVKRADDPLDSEEGDDRDGFDPSDPDSPQPDASANGSGQNRDDNRRDRNRDDEDGERRSRRNRGRQRRGRGDEPRGDESRGDEARADEPRGDDNRGDDRSDVPRADTSQNEDRPSEDTPERAEASAKDVLSDTTTDAAKPSTEANGDAGEATAEERPRRAPRQRKARVEVADRFDGEDQQASDPAEGDSKPVPEAPKPVSLGDDVPPVQQAASDDT
jgi:hypothetical protein